MGRKVFFLKAGHTVIFFFQTACLFYILYAGITRTFNAALAVAIIAIMLNGVALLLNRWRCPLTTFAEKHGAVSGSVTDIFLPKWIADNVFRVAVVLFPAELVLLAIRYFLG